jgi:hypothetical protein
LTTIAFKDGTMACDSCWSLGNAVDTLTPKITRLKSGGLLGQSGGNDGRIFIEILENVKTFKGLPSYNSLLDIRASFLGLLVLPNKEIIKIATTFAAPGNWTEDNCDDVGVWAIDHDFTAVGSGADFAIGAMAFGSDAKTAVKIACRYDINSRPPIHTMTLGK